MRIEDLNQEVKDKVKQLLDNAPAEEKAEAIMQSIEMINEAAHADLIQQVVAEAERASRDAEYKSKLGLRNLSQEEKKFYENFKDIKQAFTANQIDIIPTEIIDCKYGTGKCEEMDCGISFRCSGLGSSYGRYQRRTFSRGNSSEY